VDKTRGIILLGDRLYAYDSDLFRHSTDYSLDRNSLNFLKLPAVGLDKFEARIFSLSMYQNS